MKTAKQHKNQKSFKTTKHEKSQKITCSKNAKSTETRFLVAYFLFSRDQTAKYNFSTKKTFFDQNCPQTLLIIENLLRNDKMTKLHKN